MNTSRIELLETRIAPATLLPGGKGVTYTDVDGDLVTVTFSKGQVSAADFTFDTAFADTGPQQLRRIELSDDGAEFSGAKVTMTVKAAPGSGDGFANVGFLSAKGVDLDAVKISGDLGRFEVGDADAKVIGLKSLTAQSLGVFGTSTQAAGGTLRSFAYGGLGALKVAGDVMHAEINGSNADGQQNAGIGSITIGGSLLGGASSFSGQIYANGNIGVVKIGGDLKGGSGAASGQISAGGKIASVTLGGSLVGGSYNSPTFESASGAIISGRQMALNGDVGFIRIGGSMLGKSGNYSAQIQVGLKSSGNLGALTVVGDFAGSSGENGAEAKVKGNLGVLKIGGDLVGGTTSSAGRVDVTGMLGSAAIGGDLIGGATGAGGLSAKQIGKLAVGGSFIGGSGIQSASVLATSIGRVSVGDSLIGGSGMESGTILASKAGSIVVKDSLIGGGAPTAGAITIGGPIASITIGGDLKTPFDSLDYHGSVKVFGALGKLSIGGSIQGGAAPDARPAIFALRADTVSIKGSVTGDVASPVSLSFLDASDTLSGLKKLTIGGDLENAAILGGDDTFDGADLGAITIGGDFVASRIAVSTKLGADKIAGTLDDTFITAGENPLSRIASVIIKGQARGTVGGMDSFLIIAESLGKVQVHGVTVPTTTPLSKLSSTGDVFAKSAQ